MVWAETILGILWGSSMFLGYIEEPSPALSVLGDGSVMSLLLDLPSSSSCVQVPFSTPSPLKQCHGSASTAPLGKELHSKTTWCMQTQHLLLLLHMPFASFFWSSLVQEETLNLYR